MGCDLRADRDDQTLYVEVKSSTGYVTPVLTTSEWSAANAYRNRYLLALVDFVGQPRQAIHYVLDPAGRIEPAIITSVVYRLSRAEFDNSSRDDLD